MDSYLSNEYTISPPEYRIFFSLGGNNCPNHLEISFLPRNTTKALQKAPLSVKSARRSSRPIEAPSDETFKLKLWVSTWIMSMVN